MPKIQSGTHRGFFGSNGYNKYSLLLRFCLYTDRQDKLFKTQPFLIHWTCITQCFPSISYNRQNYTPWPEELHLQLLNCMKILSPHLTILELIQDLPGWQKPNRSCNKEWHLHTYIYIHIYATHQFGESNISAFAGGNRITSSPLYSQLRDPPQSLEFYSMGFIHIKCYRSILNS